MANTALDEFVVVASQDGRIQALDARDGRVRWTQTRGGHPFAGLALARAGDTVVALSFDGYVCMLALDDGTLRWERSLPIAGPIMTAPTGGLRIAANQQLAVVQLGGLVSVLALDDGHPSWEARPTPEARQWWLLAAGEGHIYTMQKEGSPARFHLQRTPVRRQPREPRDPHVMSPPSFTTTAWAVWDGTPDWFAHEGDSAVEPPWDGGSSLMEADGVVYVYGGEGLHAFAAEDGALRWTTEIGPYFPGGALSLGRDDVVVAAGGRLGVYRRDTGALLWSKTVAIRAEGSFRGYTTPLVVGDGDAVCVARTMSGTPELQIEAYEGESGAPSWVWPRPADSAASAAMANQVGWPTGGQAPPSTSPRVTCSWPSMPRMAASAGISPLTSDQNSMPCWPLLPRTHRYLLRQSPTGAGQRVRPPAEPPVAAAIGGSYAAVFIVAIYYYPPSCCFLGRRDAPPASSVKRVGVPLPPRHTNPNDMLLCAAFSTISLPANLVSAPDRL